MAEQAALHGPLIKIRALIHDGINPLPIPLCKAAWPIYSQTALFRAAVAEALACGDVGAACAIYYKGV